MNERRTFGLILMSLTLLMWGSLPLQLKILISQVDPTTLTWYRFTGALLLLAILAGRSCLRDLRTGWSRRTAALLLLAGVGLVCNYLTYLKGLDHLTPSTAQILMQTVPFMVLGGGILIFNEAFAGRQWWGVLFLALGSALFFNQRLDQVALGSDFLTGVGFILTSAICWTTFLMAQKALLPILRSRTIMICCYLIGSLILLPMSTLNTIVSLDTTFLILVASATIIAVVSYLTFATALRHVPATTAGLTIANIPLITLLCMLAFADRTDLLQPENLNTTALIGAVLVVLGSALGALGPKQNTTTTR
jgi:drug/metabolite transporter (DMT)-like permease